MRPFLVRWVFFCLLITFATFSVYHLEDFQDYVFGPSLPPYYSEPDIEDRMHVNWKQIQERYPVESPRPLPTGPPVKIPKVQFDFPPETAEHKIERQQRLDAVKQAFMHSWSGYKQHAWLQDEIMPISGTYKNPFGGWGATLVDALDTLYIMGLQKEFATAIGALKKVDFGTTRLDKLNVFETTIRYLGGLLSAHDLSGGKYPILLDKATELGQMLYAAFDTPNRMPITHWNWRAGATASPQEAPYSALAAEIGSLSLEFTRLSQITGDPKWFDAVQRISDQFDQQQNDTKIPGLWPVRLNPQRIWFNTDRTFTFGGMSDSLYEYIPKQHLMLGGLVDQHRKMYESAVEAAKQHLFFRPLNPENQDILISGTAQKDSLERINLDPEGQHLTCFVGGMMGLGGKIFDRPEDLEDARKLVDGCIWAYDAMPAGIMPERFRVVPCANSSDCEWSETRWHNGIASRQTTRGGTNAIVTPEHARQFIKDHSLAPGFTEIDDGRYILRPEAIESIFVMYRITGDERLQNKAWDIFQKVENLTRTEFAHAGIADVTSTKTRLMDTCESFWMAETLKYFYLIFSEPDVVSLDEWVLNTEAHPLRRPQ